MSPVEVTPGQNPKTETVECPFGQVSYSPERGGIITSIKLKGQEILYLDESTFKDRNVSVKGGIPILFPNAGPIPNELKQEPLGNLLQHGFARDSNKWTSQKTANGFIETLTSNTETKKIFPYDFKLSIVGSFEADGSFTIIQTVQNTGETGDVPLSMGLHPYFQVPNAIKKDIRFDFSGGDFVRDNIEKWANGKAVTIDNPQFIDNSVKTEVVIPTVGTFTFDIPKEYQKIWVWSLPDKDFICVEPIMRSKGGIIKDPQKISPGENFSLRFNIKLEGE